MPCNMSIQICRQGGLHSKACDSGWTASGNTCLKSYSAKKEWNDAKKECEKKGARLAVAHNDAEFKALADLVKGDGNDYWVGAKGLEPKKSKKTRWVDDSDFEGAWTGSEPNENADEACGRIAGGALKDKKCNNKYPYICESVAEEEVAVQPAVTNTCQGGWTATGNTCLKRFDGKKKWDDAKKECEKKGAQLAVAHNDAEFKALADFVNGRGNDYWVGAKGLEPKKSKKTRWVDDSDFEGAWTGSEPNENADEACGRIAGGALKDKKCDNKYPYICESVDGEPAKTEETQNDGGGSCASGWKKHDGMCYKRYGSKKKWSDAEKQCNKYGAHLATIHSAATLAFLDGITNSDTWVGAQADLTNNGETEWVDGTPYDFDPWKNGEPNESGSNSCGRIVGNAMRDRKCTKKFGYLCMRAPGSGNEGGRSKGSSCKVRNCVQCSGDSNKKCDACEPGFKVNRKRNKCKRASAAGLQCTGKGDVHYGTFDGAKIDFQGDCQYQLLKTTNIGADLIPIDVQVSSKKRKVNDRVSFVRDIFLMYGTQKFAFTNANGLLVDGTQVNSEFKDAATGITISVNGDIYMLSTAEGFSLKYDRDARDKKGYVIINIPEGYAGLTEGLCGNSNSQKDDDYFPKGKTSKAGHAVIGDSWKIPDADNRPACKTDTPPDECPEDKLAKATQLCSDLFNHAVMTDCMDIIKEENEDGEEIITGQLGDCIYDLCRTLDTQISKCSAAEGLIAKCQASSNDVIDWRGEFNCPLACPAHSTFSLDVTLCDATCLNPNPVEECQELPAEGCPCDEGFVRSDGDCIPVAECGCTITMKGNKIYKSVGSKWVSDDCDFEYTCEALDKVKQKRLKKCGRDASCGLKEGVRGCVCNGGFSGDGYKCWGNQKCECTGAGDAHFHTCDSQWVHFQGDCTYIAAETCTSDASVEPFRVITDLHKFPEKPTVSFVKSVYVTVYGITINMLPDTVLANGIKASVPISMNNNKLTVTSSGRYLILSTDFGLVVKMERKSNTKNKYALELPSAYMNKICGMCGNYNGDKNDDLFPKGASAKASYSDIGDSWAVSNPLDDACTNITPPDLPECAEINENTEGWADCKQLVDNLVFEDCTNVLGEEAVQGFLESCTFDICKTDDVKFSVCDIAQTLVDVCNKNMDTPVDWREAFGCPFACGANSEYSHNMAQCEASCKDRNPDGECYEKPVEGCPCLEGFMRSGDNCIPVSECGCLEEFEGEVFYHEPGQIWTHDECSMSLHCEGERVVEEDGCGENANCVGEPGARKCTCNEGFFGNGSKCEESCRNADKNCDECNDDNTCKTCAEKNFMDADGVCQLCARESCEECDANGACKTCAEGLEVNANDNCQGPCTVKFCDKCVVDKTQVCEKCTGDAELSPEGLCDEKCTSSTKNCAVCDPDNVSKCQACQPNFYLDSDNNLCIECTLDNCFECESGGRCKSCKEGFFVDASGQCQPECTETDPQCKFCDVEKRDECLICKTADNGERRYLSADGKCTDCETENCLICEEHRNGECKTCDARYVPRDGECKLICTERDEHCVSCDEESQDICVKCKDTYYAVGDGTGLCQKCSKANCQKCGSDGGCEKCASGFFIVEGDCIEECSHRDVQCTKCKDDDLSACETCNVGRFVSDEDGTCKVCDVENCKECNGAGKCVDCRENYIVANDGAACNENCLLLDANCGKCKDDDQFKCDECTDERFYQNPDGTCVECHRDDCQLCNPDGTCKACEEGSSVNVNGNCQGPCKVRYCTECVVDDEESCETCQEGYEKKGSICVAPCTKAIEFCLDCEEGDVEVCAVCTDGYYRAVEGHCAQCTLLGCQECESDGATCKACRELYFMDDDKLCSSRCTTVDGNCAECKADDPGACDRCSLGTVLTDKGTCEECELGNCETCKPDLTCEKCKTDYFVGPEGTCNADCSLLDENCRECDKDDESACVSCNDGFFVGDDDDRCHSCHVPECAVCDTSDSSGDACKDCKEGFFVNDLKQCQATCQAKDENCEACDTIDQGVCERCKDDMFVADATKNCEACVRPNCKQCDGVGRCAACESGFAVNENGNCQEPCNLPDCKECVLDNSNECDECEDKFLVDPNTKKCVDSCQVQSCAECEAGNPFICTQCDVDNYLDLDKQCQECSRGENCVRCNADSTCAECSGEFFVNENGNCQETCATDENCKKCNDEDKSKCDKCNEGMYVQEGTGMCMRCERQDCDKCNPDGRCQKCAGSAEEFFVNQEGDCQPPCTADTNCKSCEPNNLAKCDQCIDGFYADGETGGCKECIVANCEQCKPDGTCEDCAEGTTLELGTCQDPCKIDRCVDCVFNDVSKCEQCEENFILNPLTADCYEDCQVKDCDQCISMDPEACEDCADGFFLSADKQCQKCKKPDCETCAPDGSCAICDSGFGRDEQGGCEPICELADCDKCNTDGECTKCDEGFKVRDGECTPNCQVPKCNTCNTDGKCVDCQENFEEFEGNCVRVCDDPNCEECGNDGVCTKCPIDMYLADEGKDCTPCEIENCDSCNGVGECKDCKEEYQTDDNGGCTPLCKVPKCDLCDLQGECVQCEDNFVRALGACTPCKKSNCNHCTEEGYCDACAENFQEGADGDCEPVCDVDNCAGCNEPNKCQDCQFGFFLKDGVCTECSIPNCDDCSDGASCTECAEDYEMTEGKTCEPRCEEDFCASCKSPDVCGDCKEGYTLTDNVCVPNCEVQNCLACGEPDVCDSCKTGFTLQDDKSCQVACNVENCAACDAEDQCKTCKVGFVLNADTKACDETPCKVPSCEKCVLGSTDTCETCSGDTELMEDGKLCKEPCNVPDCVECEAGNAEACKICPEGLMPNADQSGCEEPCKVPDCVECEAGNAAACKICPEGLMPNADQSGCEEPCKVPDCVECEAGNAAACKICPEGLMPNADQSGCEEPCKVPDCVECEAGNVAACKICPEGLMPNADQSGCEEPCKVPDCVECEAGNAAACKICPEGLMPNADQSGCEEQCKVPDCVECEAGNAAACKICPEGLMPNADKSGCEEPCNVPDCVECEAGNAEACKICPEGLMPNADQSGCEEPCKVPDCVECEAGNAEACKICPEGMMPNDDKSGCEEPCNVPDCVECEAGNAEACKICPEGLMPNADQSGCEEPCGLDNCAECETADRCKKCAGDMVVNDDSGVCEDACLAADCLVCEEGSSTRCETCKGDMMPNDDGQCEPPVGPCNVKDCEACEEGSSERCEVCVEGFMPADDGSCEPIEEPEDECTVPNCKECFEDDMTFCQDCVQGYDLTDEGTCEVRWKFVT